VTARQIQMEVCTIHQISPEKLINGGNKAEFVAARGEAMARCREELGMSYTHIGRLFRKHHTTVLYAIGKYHEKHGLNGHPNPDVERSLERALVKQARVIASQGRVIAEQAKQLEALAEVGELCARAGMHANGQQQLFQEKTA
jgi:hypothetical protein